MISTEKLSLQYGSRTLFDNVDIKFTPGNCYGLIGANGAGKSTFLRCLSGEQEPSGGKVIIPKGQRLNVLRQDHFAYDETDALTTVIMGHARLYEVMVEKDAIYLKVPFTDEDGTRAAELEGEFGELDGWNAESNAGSLLSALGIAESKHRKLVKELDDSEKVRVLLAQALFGEPDILLLDEPTNHLDVDSILWLEEFLMKFKSTVIVVSHDRHFLDKVCTHVADVDFQKVQLFTGNYSFWYETSQLALRQRQDSNKRKEDKIKDLKAFIQRFSANASKSAQATSRRQLLDKITLDDIKPSSRKYPYIVFDTQRELGKEVLFVDGVSKSLDGVTLFKNMRFSLAKGEKVAITGNDVATSALLQVLSGELKPDAGEVKWGRTVNLGYFPKDNAQFFQTDKNLIEWMRIFSANQEEGFVRSFLGRMLFSGEETKKSASVLSGGEKVRCMLARMMLQDPNVLLLDGPTNHLDLESITALNNGLLKFPGSMIVNSHDVQFVESLVTRVIELDGDVYHDLNMGYEEYLANPARLERMAKKKG
ncbi:MAG: transporter ATP-binding protein uup [Myxococcaceae bacterium]|nr:transporter ATP-binding protein uup [Myxococcaceae bacterium]